MTRAKTGDAVNDSGQAKAWREQRDVRQKLETTECGALRRAISDVMDGTLGFMEAFRNHGVSETRLREALRAAGWKSGRERKGNGVRRRTFGSGRRRGSSPT